ncbi:MAG TPA: hypothetical protein VHC69_21260 [Polyangiaceae bacterium]|nr:hypothetical protein [Polyangiaceae bacterium]
MAEAACAAGVVTLSAQWLRQHFEALRFLYTKTLGRPEMTSFLSWPKDIEKLTVVLTESQVHRLLTALRGTSTPSAA